MCPAGTGEGPTRHCSPRGSRERDRAASRPQSPSAQKLHGSWCPWGQSCRGATCRGTFTGGPLGCPRGLETLSPPTTQFNGLSPGHTGGQGLRPWPLPGALACLPAAHMDHLTYSRASLPEEGLITVLAATECQTGINGRWRGGLLSKLRELRTKTRSCLAPSLQVSPEGLGHGVYKIHQQICNVRKVRNTLELS